MAQSPLRFRAIRSYPLSTSLQLPKVLTWLILFCSFLPNTGLMCQSLKFAHLANLSLIKLPVEATNWQLHKYQTKPELELKSFQNVLKLRTCHRIMCGVMEWNANMHFICTEHGFDYLQLGVM